MAFGIGSKKKRSNKDIINDYHEQERIDEERDEALDFNNQDLKGDGVGVVGFGGAFTAMVFITMAVTGPIGIGVCAVVATGLGAGALYNLWNAEEHLEERHEITSNARAEKQALRNQGVEDPAQNLPTPPSPGEVEQQQNPGVSAEITQLSEMLQKMQQGLDNLTQQNEELKAELKKSQADQASQLDSIKALTEQATKLTNELELQREENVALRKENSDLLSAKRTDDIEQGTIELGENVDTQDVGSNFEDTTRLEVPIALKTDISSQSPAGQETNIDAISVTQVDEIGEAMSNEKKEEIRMTNKPSLDNTVPGSVPEIEGAVNKSGQFNEIGSSHTPISTQKIDEQRQPQGVSG